MQESKQSVTKVVSLVRGCVGVGGGAGGGLGRYLQSPFCSQISTITFIFLQRRFFNEITSHRYEKRTRPIGQDLLT